LIDAIVGGGGLIQLRYSASIRTSHRLSCAEPASSPASSAPQAALRFACKVVIPCNVPGALTGTRLALRGGSVLVRRIFIVVVSGLILRTAWTAFR
jgi:hypothetical protein